MLAGTLVVLVISCRRLLGVARCALWKRLLSFGKDILITDPWFSTLDRLICPCVTGQVPYQHQTDTASRHFRIDGIAATEMKLEQFLLLAGWNTDSGILHFHAPRIIVLWYEICTLPFSGVYFNAFDIIFFRIDSIFPCQPYIHIPELLYVRKLICLILA